MRNWDIKERIKYAFQHSIGTDITITIGVQGEPTYAMFEVHRALLMACSLHFRKLLRTKRFGEAPYINFPNCHSKYFKEVLRYIYTDVFFASDPMEFANIYHVALAFKVSGLLDACNKRLGALVIGGENCLPWLEVSFKLKKRNLADVCEEYIVFNVKEVFLSKRFLEIHESLLHFILNMQNIQLASDIVMLEAILRWVKANEDYWLRKNINILSVTDFFLKHVDFVSITARDFEKLYSQYTEYFPMITALDIFETLTNPRDRKPWMYEKGKRLLFEDYLLKENFNGPSIPVETQKFIIPVDEAKYTKKAKLLETTFRFSCKRMPLLIFGASVLCPECGEQDKVRIEWETSTFGTYEQLANYLRYEKTFSVKNSQVLLRFRDPILLETSVTFVLIIKVFYEKVKLLKIPRKCLSPTESTLLTPYGRCPYFIGDAIVMDMVCA